MASALLLQRSSNAYLYVYTLLAHIKYNYNQLYNYINRIIIVRSDLTQKCSKALYM